jgi:hypothetical protein
MDRNKIPHDPCHLGSSSGVSKMISEPMVRSVKTRLPLSPIGPKRASLGPHHLGVTLGASKRFLSQWYIWCEPCTHLAQTLTLSPKGLKWDSTWPRHLWVSSGASKTTSDLWYVRRELCSYLASRLTLFPNGLKWASTWALLARRTIGWVQNNLCAYGTFCANRAPILHRD